LIYLFINSSSALAVKSLASEFKVPIVSGGAADSLGVPADPYLFKVAPGIHDFMTVLAQFAQKKGYKRVALLNMTTPSAERSEVLQGACPQHGIEVWRPRPWASRTRTSTRS